MQRSGNIFTAAALALILATSCSHETLPGAGAGEELRGIKADICATTRAVGDGVYTDESGRLKFQDGDAVVITKMQRTVKPLSNYSYRNLEYSSVDEMLERSSKGKVYWSDNAQGHTFIGYSLPQAYPASHWALVEDAFYEGFMSYETTDGGVNVVDFTAPENFADEDVVLTYATDVTPDASGYFALLKFHHGLSRVKVVVNIKGFASASTVVDTQTYVSDMVMKNQNIKYRWTQTDDGFIAPNENIKADIKMWCEDEDGKGTKDDKTFVFYGYAVPGKQKPSFDFVVTYPNAVKPDQLVSYHYTATMPNDVELKAGYCTEIDIDLNHKNEKIIIGASFTDWETAKSPDQGNLVKSDSFIHASNEVLIKLHDETDNLYTATWLYTGEDGNVLDMEGHTGNTREDAYRISSGLQLQSFAAEVAAGFTFADKWVMLDADIFMQEKVTSSNYSWEGIGDAGHNFQGIFLGQGRFIRRLKGSPFFNTIGEDAVIDRLRIETLSDYSVQLGVLTYKDNALQGGSVALVNNGVICGCEVTGYVSGETSVMGLVQSNGATGHILASSHIGSTEADLFEGYPDNTDDPYVACFHYCTDNTTGSNIVSSSLNADIAAWNAANGTGGTGSFVWNIDYTFADNIGSHPTIQ